MNERPVRRTLNSAIDRIGLARVDAQELGVSIAQRAFDQNWVSRMSLVRRHHPITKVGRKAVLVTRREDVLAILADSSTFLAPYVHKLPGPFVLGVDGVAHDQQRHTVAQALSLTDVRDKIDKNVTRAATEIVHRGRAAGHLNVGSDLIHPVLGMVLEDFLGLPSPDSGTMWFWARDIFEDIFLNLTDLPMIHERAVIATAFMSEHVRAVVRAQEKEGAPDSETVLGRLLAMRDDDAHGWLDEHAIVSTLIGLAIGWLWHGARAPLIIIDFLLDHPDAHDEARSAASAHDHDRLGRVLWEVLRFRPVQPVIVRTAATATTIAAGTARATEVGAGTTILTGTHSAMWDEAKMPCPARFDTTRADDQYLIFGHGSHRCQGEDINRIQLPAMLAPLLAAGDLQRGGRLRWDGPRADDLRVRFRP